MACSASKMELPFIIDKNCYFVDEVHHFLGVSHQNKNNHFLF